jgi:exodeoxyribonuclease VIII
VDDISIDLETLGKRYNAPVLSIGAVQFDRMTSKIGSTFYKEIEIASAIKAGVADASTLTFWVNQSEKARRVFNDSPNKVALATALDELSTWVRSRGMAPRVWGNGASFDITILEHAYDNGCVGLKEAWHYTNIRDMRTAVDMADLQPNEWPENVGTHHNALDDATFQAKVISICFQKVRARMTHGRTVALPAIKPVPVNLDDL